MRCWYNFHNLEILTFLMSITPFPSYDYKVQHETQTSNQRGNPAKPESLMKFESLQLLVTVCLLLQFFLSCCIMLSENYNNSHTSWSLEFARSSRQLFEKLKPMSGVTSYTERFPGSKKNKCGQCHSWVYFWLQQIEIQSYF